MVKGSRQRIPKFGLWLLQALTVCAAVLVVAPLIRRSFWQPAAGEQAIRQEVVTATRKSVRLLSRGTKAPYTCWEPAKGLSSPLVTLLTISVAPPHIRTFVHRNRAYYALEHGYRFCEVEELSDLHRTAVHTKLAVILALLPCTDYVVHVDADAIFVNYRIPLTPWLQYMESRNLDLVVTKDYIRESPINFGVFLVHSASWVYDFFQEMYNRCPCDWPRLKHWPAEQGILYDLLSENKNHSWLEHTEGVTYEVLNNHFNYNRGMKRSTDLIVHYCGYYEKKKGSEENCNSELYCKFEGIMDDYVQAVKRKIAHSLEEDPDPRLVKEDNSCASVVRSPLTSESIYDGHQHKHMSSVLDWEVDDQGKLRSIHLNSFACVGKDQGGVCDLKRYWNSDTKSGPWMLKGDNVFNVMNLTIPDESFCRDLPNHVCME